MSEDRQQRNNIPWKRKCVYSAVPAVLFLVMLELGLRIWVSLAGKEVQSRYALITEMPEAVRFRPHHYLCYDLQPGYERGPTKHNSLGYRGDEFAVPKPKGVYRIAILGGSTTYTEFVRDNDKTFPAALQQLLNQRQTSKAKRIEVINAGVPGYSSWESLANLAFRVLDIEPDLIIVYHGINDAHCRLVAPKSYRADNSGRRTMWTVPVDVTLLRFSMLARVVGHHTGMWSHPGVDAFVRAPTCDPGVSGYSERIGGDPMAVLDRNPPLYFERNLRNMVAIAQANKAKIILATWAYSPEKGDYCSTPHYRRALAEGNDVVRTVCREMAVPCFDFVEVMPTDVCYWRDGRHVNTEGAAVKARLFADFLLDDYTSPLGPAEKEGSVSVTPPVAN